MSSLLSPQQPSADGVVALGAAAVRVAEDSLFAYAETCDAATTSQLLRSRPALEPFLTARIAFAGPFDGVVQVSLPRALAAGLAAAFCGFLPEDLDEVQIADFAGELANMVCGSWLTQSHRAERFGLAAPVVVRATAAGVDADLRAQTAAVGVVVNDAPIAIALVPRADAVS
jgi:CheY-specific phosphatase CheX